MHKKFSKLISNGTLIASALVTIPLAISACNGGSSNGGSPQSANKWVFVSQSSPNGAMVVYDSSWQPTGASGIAKADAICQHDAESTGWIPESAGANQMIWKAMLVDGTNRSISKDWVFKPATTYKDIRNSNLIGTTTGASTFDFPLTNVWGKGDPYPWNDQPYFVMIWSGLSQDWSQSPHNCSGFTTATLDDGGSSGAVYGYSPTFGPPAYFQESSSIGSPFGYTCALSSDPDAEDRYTLRLLCVSQ